MLNVMNLSGMSMVGMTLALAAGLALDLLLGEASRWHPLVGFGRLADWLERHLNGGRGRIARGLCAWLLAVLPACALVCWLCRSTLLPTYATLTVQTVTLYFCLGLRSLREHNLPIARALEDGDLAHARRLTARIVSRDTSHADAGALAAASTESLLENGNDAVFGTLFWFAVAGAPGALLFRLANTLDAMWGYRTARFLSFGRVAARIDDALNFIPARLTALSYVLLAASMADRRRAWHCWRTQARQWSSPNAGPVMASGAGALGLALGGAAIYDGVEEQRPQLGCGAAAAPADIRRAWQLVAATADLWLACLAGATAFIHFVWCAHA